MKKAVWLEPGKLEVQELEIPKAGPGEVIVENEACAVCGTDVETYFHGQRHSQLPTNLGHELAGVITEVGEGVTEFVVGDKVALNQSVPCGECYDCLKGRENLCDHTFRVGGGFGEIVPIPAIAVSKGNLLKMPKGLDFDVAIHAEALAAVVNAQKFIKVGLGDTVVVLGAGAVGCMHAQLAKSLGATNVILADVSDERLEAVREMSRADRIVNVLNEDLREIVLAETEGRLADKVIVANSNGNSQEQGLSLVGKHGYVSFFGFTNKEWPTINLDSNDCHYREYFVTGAFAYSRLEFKLALDLLAAGTIDTKGMNTHVYPLAETAEALANMKAGKGLKTVIKFA